MIHLPEYDELPRTKDGIPSGWGIFGEQDSIGLMNLLTPDAVKRAVSLVKDGTVFALDAELDFFDPPLFGRTRMIRNSIQTRGGRGQNETYDDFDPQSASQWDSLAHVAYADNVFYNGATVDDVLNNRRNTIDNWARRGIVGRAVLIDLARTSETNDRHYSPGSSHSFTVQDFEEARRAANVSFEVGDIILLRTGFGEWYSSLDQKERERISTRESLEACGIEHTEEMARYLWNTHACAVATDCPALEVWPMDLSEAAWPFGALHQIILGQFGMGIGELWWLEDLARACAEDQRYEFMLTSAPLHTVGGIGSTANALAIR